MPTKTRKQFTYTVSVIKKSILTGDPEHELRENLIYEQTVDKLDLKKLIEAVNPE